jgi:hypothetical protein
MCEELGCNKLAFGDKAGLHRHEAEKHGKHNANRYFCPIQSCPRAVKGFLRKKNRDVHVSNRHQTRSAVGSGVFEGPSASPAPEQTESGSDRLSSNDLVEDGPGNVIGDVAWVRVKLMQLEKESGELGEEIKELSDRKARKDEYIQAFKKTMQLVEE